MPHAYLYGVLMHADAAAQELHISDPQRDSLTPAQPAVGQQ
jgi:hypothetical protein